MSEKTIISIDPSELNNWDLCKYKWSLQNERLLRHVDRTASMERGSVFHEFARPYYTLKKRNWEINNSDSKEQVLTLDKIIKASIAFGLKSAIKFGTSEEIGAIINNFKDYAEFYKNETWIPLEIERVFTKLLYEDEDYQILLHGKIDLIFEIQRLGKGIADHKYRARHWEDFSLDNQKLGYCWATELDRFFINEVGTQKSYEPSKRFVRQMFSYSQEQLDEWKEETIFKVKEMLAYQHIKKYPKNYTSCTKFSGCIFREWCAASPDRREYLIGKRYIIGERFDPALELEKVP